MRKGEGVSLRDAGQGFLVGNGSEPLATATPCESDATDAGPIMAVMHRAWVKSRVTPVICSLARRLLGEAAALERVGLAKASIPEYRKEKKLRGLHGQGMAELP